MKHSEMSPSDGVDLCEPKAYTQCKRNGHPVAVRNPTISWFGKML